MICHHDSTLCLCSHRLNAAQKVRGGTSHLQHELHRERVGLGARLVHAVGQRVQVPRQIDKEALVRVIALWTNGAGKGYEKEIQI